MHSEYARGLGDIAVNLLECQGDEVLLESLDKVFMGGV
jgi:hypothetical protein